MEFDCTYYILSAYYIWIFWNLITWYLFCVSPRTCKLRGKKRRRNRFHATTPYLLRVEGFKVPNLSTEIISQPLFPREPSTHWHFHVGSTHPLPPTPGRHGPSSTTAPRPFASGLYVRWTTDSAGPHVISCDRPARPSTARGEIPKPCSKKEAGKVS